MHLGAGNENFVINQKYTHILYETILVMEDCACNISEFGNEVQNTWQNKPEVREVSFSDANKCEKGHPDFCALLLVYEVTAPNVDPSQHIRRISHCNLYHFCPQQV